MNFSILVHPWDLLDEGRDVVLDRLRGEVGVTGVTLVAACPALSSLRMRRVEPQVVQCDGGLLFAPDESRYDATRLRPLASSWVKARESLDVAVEGVAAQGLTVRIHATAAAPGRFALRHRSAAAKNIFDIPSQYSLCLANPDVRAYLLGLCGDLRHRSRPAALVLSEFQLRWGEALSGQLAAGAAASDRDRQWLSMCFCESCRQGASAAGVNVAAAARTVEALAVRFVETARSTGPDIDAVLADNEPLAAYIDWGSGVLVRLLAECRSAVGGDVLVRGSSEQGWCPPPAVPASDRMHVVLDVEELAAPPAGAEAYVPAEVVNRTPSSDLVRCFALAAQSACRGIEVGPYGLLTDESISNLRQAIRFARRTG
jgi:hypothetical protein